MKTKLLTRMACWLLVTVLLAAWQPAIGVQAEATPRARPGRGVPLPTLTPTRPITELIPYTNPDLGFSIGYPADWKIEETTEDTVTFTSEALLTMAMVGKAPGIGFSVTPSVLSSVIALLLGSQFGDVQITSTGTEVLNNIEWGIVEMTGTYEQMPLTMVMFITLHEEALYFVVGAAHSELFDLRRGIFRAMMESFRFLSDVSQPTSTLTSTPSRTPTRMPTPMRTPTRTPTPTPSPDCLVKVRILNVRAGPGTIYPVISSVRAGDALRVIGEAYNCGWLKVVTPKGITGWVSGNLQYVTLYRSCTLIPAAPIPPTPTPSPTPLLTRRLPNCTVVQDAGWRDGRGELTVINRRGQDAVAVLATPDNMAVVSFYVSTGNSCTMSGIRDGTYTFYFASGEDWDSGRSEFTRRAIYFRASNTYQFTTRDIPGGVEYTQWTITLGEGPEPVEMVNKGQFPRLR
ncbi:MAG: SH3 domain-containing protein [Anaerolineae bacterium]|nr:SH3 domain-containing protein [Anaerolineae bacterium]MDW8100243.1 SH3 domain-containing protein [Anaerolineae bacterium]